MGAACCANIGSEQQVIDLKRNIYTTEQLSKSQLDDFSEVDTNIYFPIEILDDDFSEVDITEAIGTCLVSTRIAYYGERDRIVNEMRHSAPKLHHNLLFFNYPNKNEAKVNGMARKKVTSREAKQQLNVKINEMIEPSFTLQTSDWNCKSRGMARLFIKTFIEKLVNEPIDHILLKSHLKNL